MRFIAIGLFIALLPLAAQSPPAPQKKEGQPASQAKEPVKTAPAEPEERRQSNYVYDVNGRPAPGNPSAHEQRRGTGSGSVVDREEYLRDPQGRPVTVRRSQERVLSQKDDERATERAIQRYDSSGRPTYKQLVRTERSKMPDGSTVSTEAWYEQDANGRMQFVERRTTTEKKTDAGGNAATAVERPGINGGLQVVERIDRTETKRSDAVTEVVSSRKLLDGNGRFSERDRELSLVTKSGNTTTTETKQWQLGPTGQMDFVSRSVSRLKESPEGSQTEDIEVYSTKIAGTTPDLNRPQVPTLEQQVHREKKVQPDGKTVETTTARLRQVADPSRLGGLMVTEQVVTPTPEGKSIQTTVSERDANGKIVRVRSEVEEQKK